MELLISDPTSVREEIIESHLRLRNERRLAALSKFGDESSSRYRFLALARDEGSFGDEIAQELSRRMGWHIFDKEIAIPIPGDGPEKK